MRSLLPILGSSLVALCLFACGADPSPEPEEQLNEFEFQIGTWDPVAEVFHELAEGDPVPLVQGFQGLIFVNLALLGDREIPARFEAEAEIVFEDYDERYAFSDPQLLFEPLDDTWRVVPSFRVPFDLPVSELTQRPVLLRISLRSEDWAATKECRFWIADANCHHNPDGSFVCDD